MTLGELMHARTPLAVHVTLTLVTVATLAGCSAADVTTTASGAEPSSAPATARTKPLSEAELRALTLEDTELPEARPGGISVQDHGDPTDYPSFKPDSDPDCQSVHDIGNARTASAVVTQVINWRDGIYGGGATLASYDDGEAEQLFARLKRALNSCHTYQGDGWTGTYTSTMQTQKAPKAGDEAVQFREYSPTEQGKRDQLFVIVRTGNVIATYDSLDIGRTSTFPTEPIIKQAERLRDAQSK
ncbi:hypothetical protein [Streptomyces sp. NPDC059378]|uniref:hypothetical protein n=1 Tax=Streptomyces sp. NPDC059378 TaxID=3346815 RepID=UPI0036905BC1